LYNAFLETGLQATSNCTYVDPDNHAAGLMIKPVFALGVVTGRSETSAMWEKRSWAARRR
jgi:hypothetical protein